MPSRRLLAVAVAGVIGLASCTGKDTEDGGAQAQPTPSGLPAIDARLVPIPVSVGPDESAAFPAAELTRVVAQGDDEVAAIGTYAAGMVTATTGRRLEVETGQPAGDAISLEIVEDDRLGSEGYELEVTRAGIRLRAHEPAGLFHAVQTLRQIMPLGGQGWIPGGTIVDTPRFSWRGAMLDVARHFFTADEVKRYIDLIAVYKLNVLHLHLSDDQGWRIPIDSWPRLIERGASGEVGGGPGGSYTKEEYAEIVSYAAERYITVVPEIDMPGHTHAALASYAELNCDGRARDLYTGTSVGFSALCVDKDVTYRFVADVIGELAALTPGPYIHIGGDEVQKLSAADYAQFVERARKIVESHGKQMVGWQEVAEAELTPATVVQYWNPHADIDQAKRAVAQGARLVLSPADRVYLDMKYDESSRFGTDWAGLVDVDATYSWDPGTLIDGVLDDDVLGVEAPLWTETIGSMDAIEFMAFPRLAAAAEVAWSAGQRREWDGFRQRLAAQAPLWRALRISYYESPLIPWPSP